MKTIIGIAGPKGSGKDTVADHIVRRLKGHVKMAFALPIKQMLAIGLGLTREQLYGSLKDDVDLRYRVTPRRLMETLGTDWGRDTILWDLWFQATKSRIAGQTADVVLSDVRFENEAQLCRDNGFLIHIEGRGEASDHHEAERGVEQTKGDCLLLNTMGLPELYEQIDVMLMSKRLWTPPAACNLHDRGDEVFCSTCDRTGDKPEGVLCPNNL